MTVIERVTTLNLSINTNWLLRRVVYIFLLFYFGRLLPYADYFFGETSFINPNFFDGNILKWVVQSFNFPMIREAYPLFLILEFGLLFLGLFGFSPKVIGFLIYGCTLILQQGMIGVSNAGEQILYNSLFFLVLLEERPNQNNTFWITISNFALLAIKIEVAFLYFVAGFTKLTGDIWLAGDAFYYVSQINEYSSDWLKELIQKQYWIGVVLSYIVICYQVTFPFAIWFQKLKYKWMLIGVVFHISIGFMNGLMDFGLIMLTLYFAFYDESKSGKVIQFLSEIKSAGNKIISAKGD